MTKEVEFAKMQNEYNQLLTEVFDLDEKLEETIETEMTFTYPNINNVKRATRKVIEAQVRLKELDLLIHKQRGL